MSKLLFPNLHDPFSPYFMAYPIKCLGALRNYSFCHSVKILEKLSPTVFRILCHELNLNKCVCNLLCQFQKNSKNIQYLFKINSHNVKYVCILKTGLWPDLSQNQSPPQTLIMKEERLG